MENIFVVSGIVALIYFLLSFIDVKYIRREEEVNVKTQIKSALLVFASSAIGYYIVNNLGDAAATTVESVQAFDGSPGF